jgi:hypothetical protein
MAQPQSDNVELVRQLAKGDQAAFHSVYERYQRPIFRFAWHMSGNETTAEEVTQEVFLQLIYRPRRFDPAKGTLAGLGKMVVSGSGNNGLDVHSGSEREINIQCAIKRLPKKNRSTRVSL